MLRKESLLWRGYIALANAIDRPWGPDGRLVVLACVLAYFGALARCISVTLDAPGCWAILRAPAPLPIPAGDLIILPPTVRYMDEGGSPYVPSPYDPMNLRGTAPRSFNYPRIWLLLPRLGLTEENASAWRFAVSTVFFLAVISLFGRMNAVSGLVAAAAVCSPVVMFGVERGNTDHWLFIVLAAAVLCFRRQASALAGYALLLWAAMLKLYPALTFVALLRERTWKRRAAIAAGLGVVLTAYLFWIRDDLRMIARATPQETYLSFGRKVIFIVLSARSHFGTSAALSPGLNLLSIAVLLACVGVSCWAAWRLRIEVAVRTAGIDPYLTSFRIGAILFTGVFAIATSYNYRLVFLLFTLPQVLHWVRDRDLWGAISAAALLLVLGTLWPFPGRTGGHELINWALFLYFTTGLLLSLPVSRRGPVPRG